MSAPEIFTPEYYARLRALEADGWWSAAMRDILAVVTNGTTLPRAGVVVDVGCGSGGTLAWFSRLHPSWHTVGVDIDRTAAESAQLASRCIAQASAVALPFPGNVADVVISLDVLQHLPLHGGDLLALTEMRRILKPGGLLLLRTNAQAPPRTEDDHAHQFHRYETPELREKLQAAGFAVERLGRVNGVLGLAEILRERRALRATGRAYHGVLAPAPIRRSWMDHWKRRWLLLEGRLLLRGWSWPLGRTHLAICLAASSNHSARRANGD